MRVTVVLAMVLAAPAAFSQWTMQESGVTASLRGIDNVGGGVAWASGSDGTVLRTLDGGKKWEKCAVPPGAEKLDFRGVQAFDAKTAIVMSSGPGDLSRLYKTVDGCGTWKLVFTNPDKEGFFDALSFAKHHLIPDDEFSVSRASGTVLGDPVDGVFSIFLTSDGGDSWTKRVAQKRNYRNGDCTIHSFTAKPKEAAFAASNESFLSLGYYSFLFVTGGAKSRLAYVVYDEQLDGLICGYSANFINLPLGNGSSGSGAFAVALKHQGIFNGRLEAELMMVGGDYEHPDSNAGASLYFRVDLMPGHFVPGLPIPGMRKPKTPVHGYRSSVAYDEKLKAWITVGPNGTDVSTDDGKNWRALRPASVDAPDADKGWNALSLPFVVGSKGRIGVLRDGVVAGLAKNFDAKGAEVGKVSPR